MTTSQPLEDRQTTPLTVDDIPGPKGKPIVGNMFDLPRERTIVTLMELVREVRSDDPSCALRPVIGSRPQAWR